MILNSYLYGTQNTSFQLINSHDAMCVWPGCGFQHIQGYQQERLRISAFGPAVHINKSTLGDKSQVICHSQCVRVCVCVCVRACVRLCVCVCATETGLDKLDL